MQGRLNQTIEEIILKVNTAKAIKSSVQGHNAQMSVWTHLRTVIYVERGDNHLLSLYVCDWVLRWRFANILHIVLNASTSRPTCSLHLVLLCALSILCISCINSFAQHKTLDKQSSLEYKSSRHSYNQYAASYHQEDQLQTEVYVEFDLNRWHPATVSTLPLHARQLLQSGTNSS